jgi:hypothetical protein
VLSNSKPMFDAIVRIINDPTEHERFFDHQASDVLSELDRLLDECTGGIVPNYVRFYSVAGEVFARGYSHMMLQKVAQVALEFFQDVKAYKEGGQTPDDERWVRFKSLSCFGPSSSNS